MNQVDYEEIFEKAEVGIALNNHEKGTVGIVNERYAELIGYSRDELREMSIEEISADDPTFNQEEALEKIQRAIEGHPQRFDWLFERNDGSRFWAEVVLKRTMVGQNDRLLAFVRDISDRKQYERELEQKNNRLEDFVSIVSHDLRNPLNVATGSLELARQECDSDHLEAVARAHTRMETLVEDMLTLAKAGETVGETETVELRDVVETCWQNVETDSAELDIVADTTFETDKHRVQQVVENLLRNAIQHGGEDSTITVGTLQDGFYIEDDGQGIPADVRDEIFEPGYTTVEGGTGFGLGIVRDIAAAHGWTVDVTESSDGGARFEFSDVTVQ